jgi:hypothetical protein
VAVGLLASALLVGCADTGVNQSEPPPSGVRGTVLLGPTCPAPADPLVTAAPCTTPYSAELAILDSEGKVVTRVSSNADGTFQVDLPPGVYTIAPRNGDPYPTAPSQPVTVVAGQYAVVQVNYDSGN